jgi:hypothetical protein
MDTAQDLITDQFEPTAEGGKRLTTWYAQGHSDGLGDRLLMFDNTSAPSWEILRIRPVLAADVAFEAALRQQVERVSSMRHAAFPVVRPIAELGQEEGLAVVSTYSSGVCLTEGLKKPRNTAFGVRLLRQLVPAIAARHQHAEGTAHGALTIERLVLTSEGRLMVREHMMGSALESLALSPARLWAEFGILAPATKSGVVRLDARCDVVQIALVVIGMMAGRRIGADEYPARVRELLDEIEDRYLWHEPETFPLLRGWLERALQLGDRPFGSATDAHSALSELRDEPRRTRREPAQLPPAAAPPPSPSVTGESPPPPRVEPARSPVRPVWYKDSQVIRWAAAAVAVLAISEAILIWRLVFSDPAPRTAVETTAAAPASAPPRSEAGANPAAPAVVLDTTSTESNALQALSVATADAKAVDVPPLTAVPAKTLGPPAPSRSGGFRVSAPVEVHVLDGERFLGSSGDGPIIASVGRHEFEFVNSAIGYRDRRVVDIRPGEITTLSVVVPNGTLNINATPWASVWIDGNPVGDTPLGNLSVTPGEHEVVFRHPQFGERRQRAIVRVDGATRVAVNFQ